MFKRKLFELYKKLNLPTNEVSAEIDMILDYLNINPLKELLYGDFSEEEKNKILEIVKNRISTNMPLQHIVGFGYFMGEKFYVNKHTLIPRPETEILVRECLKLIKPGTKILDIGTGTACIAIELSKNAEVMVDAADISEKALEIAKKNAKLHNTNCNFIHSDLFSNIKEKYDFIISNPPYIPIKDMEKMSDTVKKYEPHAALFTKDELGIEFYKKIINKSVTFLNKNGYIAFEIGKGQYKAVIDLFEKYGFSKIKIFKDLDNIERVIIAKKI